MEQTKKDAVKTQAEYDKEKGDLMARWLAAGARLAQFLDPNGEVEDLDREAGSVMTKLAQVIGDDSAADVAGVITVVLERYMAPYTCELCKQTFTSAQALSDHNYAGRADCETQKHDFQWAISMLIIDSCADKREVYDISGWANEIEAAIKWGATHADPIVALRSWVLDDLLANFDMLQLEKEIELGTDEDSKLSPFLIDSEDFDEALALLGITNTPKAILALLKERETNDKEGN
jgi:hypothetical protein